MMYQSSSRNQFDLSCLDWHAMDPLMSLLSSSILWTELAPSCGNKLKLRCKQSGNATQLTIVMLWYCQLSMSLGVFPRFSCIGAVPLLFLLTVTVWEYKNPIHHSLTEANFLFVRLLVCSSVCLTSPQLVVWWKEFSVSVATATIELYLFIQTRKVRCTPPPKEREFTFSLLYVVSCVCLSWRCLTILARSNSVCLLKATYFWFFSNLIHVGIFHWTSIQI